MKAAIFKDPFKPIKMEYHKGFFYHSVDLSLPMSTSRGYGSSHESLPGKSWIRGFPTQTTTAKAFFKQTFGQNDSKCGDQFHEGKPSKVQTELARTPKNASANQETLHFQ